jgi:hypothetical protein
MQARLFPALALAALVACDDGRDGGQLSEPAALTYHHDVKPIIDARCTSCHVTGGIGPFPLTSYEEVYALRDRIGDAVSDGRMPPWPPARDCAEYLGDRSLSDEQIATVLRWIATGAVRGDPADEGPPPEAPAQGMLSRVDLSLSVPVAYTPQVRPDDHRCFVLPWPKTEDTYVSGFRAVPGAHDIVHHLSAFAVSPELAAELEAKDANDEGPGYACPHGPDIQVNHLGTWAPGSAGADFPDRSGILIAPGSRILLDVHYNTTSAEPRPDRSTIELRLDTEVAHPASTWMWFDLAWMLEGTMKIPARQTDVVHRFAADPTESQSHGQRPIRIYSVALHMHTLGSEALLRIDRADGSSECLLHIPRWDFRWQGSYDLVEPKIVNPGDKLHLACHWNNPTDRDVSWGDDTSDEMCFGTFYFTRE